MSFPWIDILAPKGAVATEDGAAIRDFGDPDRELLAARDGSIMAPLSQFGILRFTGSDAGTFLHAQLSSDVGVLLPWNAQMSAYCSPKGRVLANFLIWREAESFAALLPRDLIAAIRKRLTMFVLRSKVSIEDASSQYLLLGVSGPAVAKAVQRAFSAGAELLPMSVIRSGEANIINLGAERFLIAIRPDVAEAGWNALGEELSAVGEEPWRWLDVRAGVPWITTPTQDEFVPQMANLELIGAVNFQKGCYPGQEIVARTQYLGKLKRRLFRCHIAIDDPPAPATSLFSPALGDQACGMVVNAARAPDGGCDVLAVVQVEVAQAGDASPLRIGEPNGPALKILELPYRIPQAA